MPTERGIDAGSLIEWSKEFNESSPLLLLRDATGGASGLLASGSLDVENAEALAFKCEHALPCQRGTLGQYFG